MISSVLNDTTGGLIWTRPRECMYLLNIYDEDRWVQEVWIEMTEVLSGGRVQRALICSSL